MAASTDQIEVKHFTKEDEDDLLSFMKQSLDAWGEFESYWRWRQEGRPHSGGETTVLAKQSNSIVGCVGIVPALLTYGGAKIKASWQQDSLVSASMRGKGLGKWLVNEASRGWDLVIAKGSSKAMYSLRKSMDFLDVPHSDYLLRVNKRRATPANVSSGLIEYALSLWKSLLPLPKTASQIQVSQIHSFDKSFTTLAEKLSTEKTLRLHKTQGYLNWRYFQCPKKKYKVFRAGQNEARGAIVLNITGLDNDEGWVVDLIASSTDRECAFALLAEGVKYLEQKNVSRTWAFTTLPAARRWMYRFGFVPTRRTPRFTSRIHGDSIKPIVASASWDFWHGDGDAELYM